MQTRTPAWLLRKLHSAMEPRILPAATLGTWCTVLGYTPDHGLCLNVTMGGGESITLQKVRRPRPCLRSPAPGVSRQDRARASKHPPATAGSEGFAVSKEMHRAQPWELSSF